MLAFAVGQRDSRACQLDSEMSEMCDQVVEWKMS